MSEGPSLTRLTALIGERGRAQMLSSLMSGRALTATELADAAGVTRATASTHLGMLQRARLIAVESQGRHRYFRLANAEVAQLLESLMGAAHAIAQQDTIVGPRDPALRKARVCYDHLAGEIAVDLYEHLRRREAFALSAEALAPTSSGWRLFARLGIDAAQFDRTRRTMCRTCLDWSERRPHLAGALGAALLDRIVEQRWASRVKQSRIVRFSPQGERALRTAFGF